MIGETRLKKENWGGKRLTLLPEEKRKRAGRKARWNREKEQSAATPFQVQYG